MKLFSHVVHVTLILLLASSLVLSQPAPQGGDVLATVGDVKITREMLDNIISTIPEENRVPFLTPDGRKKILDEVIDFVLLSEAAKKQGIDKEPAVKTRLDYVQREYLAREYFRRKAASIPTFPEEQLQKYFKEHISEFKPPEEIKARHILVKTEAQANKVIEQLKAGSDFAELAKKTSIDPAAEKGGKLELMDGRDWLPRGSFEKSFEHVLFKISKGQIGGPIKTQFGWHVLKVDDRRDPEPPNYVQVRSMIRNRLEEQRNGGLHQQLVDEAKRSISVVVK